MRRFALSGVVFLAFLVLGWTAWAQTWPDDGAWHILECGGEPSFDPLGDEPSANNDRDVVGDSSSPALYFFADETNIFFRMRVDQDPRDGDEFRPFGWAVEFDTDGVRETYELLAQVDGIANPDEVSLHRNTEQRDLNDPADPAEELITAYPVTTHARGMPAEGSFASSFGDDPDFFVDWALERDDLEAEGITDATALVLVMGTSSNSQAINADLACHDNSTGDATLTGVSTDPVTPSGDTVPDSDGDGLTDDEEATLGTDPAVVDTDGDGYSDGAEVRASTDPLDPESHPTGPGIDGGVDGLTVRGGPAGCAVVSQQPHTSWMAFVVGLALMGLLRQR